MTIIKPNQSKRYIRFLVELFILLLVGGVVYVFQYNSLVGARHLLGVLEKKIQEIEIAQVDLQNAFYHITDPKSLESFAKEKQLVLDKKPYYLRAY